MMQVGVGSDPKIVRRNDYYQACYVYMYTVYVERERERDFGHVDVLNNTVRC